MRCAFYKPACIFQAIDILKTTELYVPHLKEDKVYSDPVATDLVGALLAVRILPRSLSSFVLIHFATESGKSVCKSRALSRAILVFFLFTLFRHRIRLIVSAHSVGIEKIVGGFRETVHYQGYHEPDQLAHADERFPRTAGNRGDTG